MALQPFESDAGGMDKGLRGNTVGTQDARRKRHPSQQDNSLPINVPEGAFRLPNIRIVGMNNEQMETLANKTRGLNIGSLALEALQTGALAVSSEGPQRLSPIVMDARAMEPDTTYPTIEQLQKKALKLGDKGSIEAMLQLAILAAKGKVQVEMGKPLVGITCTFDSNGVPRFLWLGRDRVGLWLVSGEAYSDYQWGPDLRVVVFSPKAA